MSFFIGIDVFQGTTSAGFWSGRDRSWCRRANRMDFSHNALYDGGGAAARRYRNKTRKALWPSSKTMAGDPSVEGYSQLGMDCQGFGRWGDFLTDGKGKAGTKFIIGSVVDDNLVPVTGATVLCYLTSNNFCVSNTTTDSIGRYMAPTPYTGAQHYVVVFNGSSAVGASVNTLIPTNADGS